jgi:hypothetical protein
MISTCRSSLRSSRAGVMTDEVCPSCGGVEIRLMYTRLLGGYDEWHGSCWECQHKWTVDRDDPVGDAARAALT